MAMVKKSEEKAKPPENVMRDSRVKITFGDGVTRTVEFKLRSMRMIEECYPIRDQAGNIIVPATPLRVILSWSRPGLGTPWSVLENFLWAGLLIENPTITKDDLSEFVDLSFDGMNRLDDLVTRSLKTALGIPLDEEEAAKAAADAEAEEGNATSIGKD